MTNGNCFSHPYFETAKQRQSERAIEDLQDHMRRSDNLRNRLQGKRILEEARP